MKASTIVHSVRNLHWSPVVATACMLYNCYMPGQSLWSLGGIFLWVIVGIAAVIRVEMWAIKQEKGETTPAPVGKKSARFLWCLIGLSIFALTAWPQELVFRLFQPQLEQFAEQLQKQHATYNGKFMAPDRPVRAFVGIYPVLDYGVEGDGAVYLVTNSDKKNPPALIGLAYNASHDGNWRKHPKHHLGQQLAQDWFVFEDYGSIVKLTGN